MNTRPTLTPLPGFLKLLAHDLRWKLLVALAQSDRRVQELVEWLDAPPNLVSYHLRRLRDLHLVTERRSTADGRDVYYSLDLDRLRELYLAAGTGLHPALDSAIPDPRDRADQATGGRVRVLFLCTENSARSQMAEGILRHLSQGQVEVHSAGSAPTTLHPHAVRALAALGIDISQQHAKPIETFQGQQFDYIITVCDRVRERCPSFPGDPEHIHWSIPDPAGVEGPEQAQHRAFVQTARHLMTRIHYLLLMIERNRRRSR
jgi:protein-tyrosine-phosphatase